MAKKIFLILMIIAVLMNILFEISSIADANETISIDGLNYELISKAGERTAKVINCERTKEGSIIIPSNIDVRGIQYSVTSIEKWAFEACDKITSIEIPDSVTSIGYEAFKYCSSLTNIEIPDSVINISTRCIYGLFKLKRYRIYKEFFIYSSIYI